MSISDLATVAGNSLVAAAVTDAWEAARHGFARLFGRGEPDPAMERRLTVTRSQLTAAPPGRAGASPGGAGPPVDVMADGAARGRGRRGGAAYPGGGGQPGAAGQRQPGG